VLNDVNKIHSIAGVKKDQEQLEHYMQDTCAIDAVQCNAPSLQNRHPRNIRVFTCVIVYLKRLNND